MPLPTVLRLQAHDTIPSFSMDVRDKTHVPEASALPTSRPSIPRCLLFDGKHGQSNRGIPKPELLIQYVGVEGPLPDDGSQPRSQDKNIFPTTRGESQGQHVTKLASRNLS